MQIERKTFLQLVSLLLFLLIMAISSVVIIISIRSVIDEITTLKEKEAKSLLYVDELRQSSDDLTKMARLYALTQDTIYYKYFTEIVEIRDGLIRRPIDYANIYWDYVLADGQIPRPGTDAVPLIDLMKRTSLSDEAAYYFINAKNSSDDLVAIEEEAFNALIGEFKDSLGNYSISGTPDMQYAVELLHNRDYHLAKAKIMSSIQDFNNFVQDQALKQINALDQKNSRLIIALIVIVILAISVIALMILIVIRHYRRHIPAMSSTEKLGSDYSLINIFREVKKAWILSMVSVLFSILIIVGFVSAGHIIKEEIEKNLEQSLNTILETTQTTILNWMNDVELTMDQLFHQDSFQTDIQNTILNNNSIRSAELEIKLESLFSHLSYYAYIISGENGNIIVSNIETLNGNYIAELDDDYFMRALKLPELNIVSSLPKGSGSDSIYNSLIKFGHSFFAEDGSYKGSFIILMDPQKRFTNVLHGGRMGSSGESYAFNRYGEMISESRFDNDLYEIGLLEEGDNSLLNIVIKDPGGDMTSGFTPSMDRVEQQFTSMASNALMGDDGINTKGYNDYRGVKVVGVWKWIEKYGFGLTTEIDHKEAFRTYNLIVSLGSYSLIFIVLLILTLTIIFILNRVKQSSLNLRIEKQKILLENTLESLTHPFYVIDANDYSLLLANSAAKKLGDTNTSKCYALTHNRNEPCDSKEDPCPLKIVAETKKPVVLEHTHFDEHGNPRIVEVSGYPIFDEQGEVVQMIEYSIDITERKMFEKQLKTQSAAMESTSNAIVITNPQGFIQWVNPAFTELTGYTYDEVIGQTPGIMKSGEHDAKFYENLWDTILGGNTWEGEITNKKSNGELYTEEMTITPVFDEKDKISQFVAIKHDITERKRLEKIVMEAKKRMEDELNVAKDIQMSMLPLIFPAFPQRGEIDVHADLIPAREVGGDFYDFYFLDESHFCFVVGDVSGKGVPAALMMAVTKTLLKSRATNDKSTASIITHVNNEIAKDNDAYMFITVFIAILNTNTGELVYTNAGHNPSFILSKGEPRVVKLSDLHGPVVGAMEDMTYTESRVSIQENDIIIAYTDGITESQNHAEELYSDAKFVEFLENWKYTTPKSLIEEIFKSVKEHEDGAEQFDDITALAIQYCEKPNNMVNERVSFTVMNKIEEINTAVEEFENFSEKNNIPLPIIQKFNIAFDELLNNIITYGYDDEMEHVIEVEVELKGERLVITIADDGIPFNPFKQSPPDTMLTVEERNVGGLGIHIVKNLMDEFSYKRNVGKNIIILIKHNINT